VNRYFLHLPNFLTGLRLAAVPVLALLVSSGRYGEAFAVFVFAGISDAADGFLAKRFGLTTVFGRFLDPAADKLLMLASFLALTAAGAVPVWLTALVIGRDIGIVFGAFLAWAVDLPLKLAPSQLGKISTAVQIGYIALVLSFLLFGLDLPATSAAAAVLVGAATLVSGVSYAALWLRALARAASRTA
jgi:cardiolipin synthase